MADESSFNQRGQKVIGQQINVGGDAIMPAPPTVFVPHLPSPPRDFTGREEELKDLLADFDRGVTITGLHGMGGIGKTALAYALAEKLADRYPDGQILVELKGTSPEPMTLAEAMASVVRAYHPEFKLPENESELAGIYRSLLYGMNVLLLLDNASNRDQVEPLLSPAGCAAIITSRNRFALPGLKEKDLDVLLLEDAKKLLLEIAGRIAEHAEKLAKLCGCLPLALRNAAYALAEKKNLGVADYVERLKDARKRLELVEASFSLSYELLTPELQRLWSLLSVFPADFDLAGAAAVWEMEQDLAEDALGELVKWSLVDFLPSAIGEGGRYRLHDLARDFADSRLKAAARTHAQQKHAEHYRNVLSDANVLFNRGGQSSITGLKLLDNEWNNIQTGHAWSENIMNDRSNQVKSDRASTEYMAALRLTNAYPNAGFLMLDLRLHLQEQVCWLEAAVVAAQRLNDRKMECSHLGNLGLAYIDQGDYRRAIETFERSLAISREIGDRRGECADLVNLGITYRNLGDFRRAIDFYEVALPISREVGDLRSEGAVLGNFGVANAALGETYKAIRLFKQHLLFSRKIEDLRGESDALGNHGLAYAELGEIRMSIDFYERSLAIDCKIGDKQGECKSLGNIGNAYINLGEVRKAIEYY